MIKKEGTGAKYPTTAERGGRGRRRRPSRSGSEAEATPSDLQARARTPTPRPSPGSRRSRGSPRGSRLRPERGGDAGSRDRASDRLPSPADETRELQGSVEARGASANGAFSHPRSCELLGCRRRRNARRAPRRAGLVLRGPRDLDQRREFGDEPATTPPPHSDAPPATQAVLRWTGRSEGARFDRVDWRR